MKKLDRIMAIIMTLTGAAFLADVIWQAWEHHAHPELYVAQSAPWYLSIEAAALITAAVMAVEMIVYFVLRYVAARREKK